MQDHLPAHAMLAIQKPLHRDLTTLAHLRDAVCQISRGLGRHVEFNLAFAACLGLTGGMGQGEIHNRQSGGRVAQRIDRGQSCAQADRVSAHLDPLRRRSPRRQAPAWRRRCC